VKTLSILLALYLFWEVLALLHLRGYPPNLLDVLEKTHFVFMFAALCVLGLNFVAKQVVGLWQK
jgi:hypothetical protein